VALCLGGTHAIENGQALCHNCHAKKSVADRRAYRIAAWQAGNAQSPTEVS
jgi:5-methylcytosine-specific restriction endonuclease McrA